MHTHASICVSWSVCDQIFVFRVCIWESVLSFCLIFEAGSLLASSTLVTSG